MRYTEDTVLAERVEAADAVSKNIPSMSMLDLVLNSLQDDKAEDIGHGYALFWFPDGGHFVHGW